MKTYDLYLDSGPMRRKTFVQVPALAGCVARGDTTDIAIERAPDAIWDYLRFLSRSGEEVDAEAAFKIRVAEHKTDGQWPAGGSGFLSTDTKPLSAAESGALMRRLAAIHDDLRRLTGKLAAKQLDAAPASGRPIRRILSHIVGAEGSYLREIHGASRLAREVEEGSVDPHDALDTLLGLETARLGAMSAAERSAIVMRGQAQWTPRAALRRMLEHAWEHDREIAERLKTAR
jgi:predicted RNase H-like HicB family nuclease